MSQNSSQDKSEAPTPRRRKKAREDGQIPRSKDLPTAASLAAASFLLPTIAERLSLSVSQTLSQPLPTELDLTSASEVVQEAGWTTLGVCGSLGLASAAATLGALVVQSPPVVAFGKLSPKLNRVAPWEGIARLDPRQTLPKGLLDLARLLVLCLVGGSVLLGPGSSFLPSLVTDAPLAASGNLIEGLQTLGYRLATAFAALAVFDFLLERYKVEQKLKMTKQEVKEEHKREEGDPFVKGRIRRIQREQARQRLASDLLNASVVVTNPTHVACALRYDPQIDAAPRLLAKGRDLVAQEIKRLAREHGVPTHEDKPLAWALLRVPLGGEIPDHLYQPVAEVLALVARAERREAEARRARERALTAARAAAAGLAGQRGEQ